MALPTSVVDTRVSDALRPYEMADAGAIETFLAGRPHLRAILLDAPARIVSSFGGSKRLRLEVFRDRDAPDSPELHVVVVTGAQSEAEWDTAETSVRRLHEDWLKALPRSQT